jgi:hypothetical protein
MTDLECLEAELARQDRELDACLEQLRDLDPDLAISVSQEWMDELSLPPPPPRPMPNHGALRA